MKMAKADRTARLLADSTGGDRSCEYIRSDGSYLFNFTYHGGVSRTRTLLLFCQLSGPAQRRSPRYRIRRDSVRFSAGRLHRGIGKQGHDRSRAPRSEDAFSIFIRYWNSLRPGCARTSANKEQVRASALLE